MHIHIYKKYIYTYIYICIDTFTNNDSVSRREVWICSFHIKKNTVVEGSQWQLQHRERPGPGAPWAGKSGTTCELKRLHLVDRTGAADMADMAMAMADQWWIDEYFVVDSGQNCNLLILSDYSRTTALIKHLCSQGWLARSDASWKPPDGSN